ncbi:formylmethanofuran dehydrogenase subunit C [Methanoculleus frigidifontis]
MMRVSLAVRPRKKPTIPIEAETITPASFLEGAEIQVWRGNRELPLDEVFAVTIEGAADRPEDVEIVLSGDTSRMKRVGEYMDAGRIVIDGDIGMHCGNFMSGGVIEIGGNADGWLGREMQGGTIICRGNAADYCAAGYRGGRKGMTGGTVEIFGNAGDFAAENLAGGTVIIHGNAGDMAGVELHDGTLIIKGDCRRPCGNMSGGVCVIYGIAYDMLPTFRKMGTEIRDGREFLSFTGDIANRGKGNLIVKDCTYQD